MLDTFIILAPMLLLPVIALLKFVGCGAYIGNAPPGTYALTVTPDPVTLSGGQSQTFTPMASWDNPAVSWSVSSTAATPGQITQVGQVGVYTTPPSVLSAYSEQVIASAADPDNNTVTSMATVNLQPGNSATFVRFDDLTQGSWKGIYGADGFALAHQPQPDTSCPGYLEPPTTPPQISLWEDPSTLVRSLQNPNATDPTVRYAYAWLDASVFTFALLMNDTRVHQVAVYCVDWDTIGREQTITMFDADTSAQLDVQSISGFPNGTYLVWLLSGRVRMQVSHTKADGTPGGGPNAVVSGIFFR
jgi:hypothetical protein